MHGDADNPLRLTCYLVRHNHCRGHAEEREWTAAQWMADQEMATYNEVNSRWAPIAARFRTNPFGPQGLESPAFKMAFMASYNIDTFRRFVFQSSYLSRYDVSPDRLDAIRENDTELLLLGFDWILRFLFGQGPMRERNEP
jgi:hypothetical protein